MDATSQKRDKGHSDDLQCTHCTKILPSYALFCSACGESLGTNISKLPLISNKPGVTTEDEAQLINDPEEDTIPRLASTQPSGVKPNISDSHIFTRLSWLWPVIIIFSAIATALFTFMFPETPLHPIVVMWFLFICPGMMLVRFLRLNELVVEWVLALALSLAIDAIVSGIVLYAAKWSPVAILGIIIGLSLAGAVTQLTMLSQASA